MLRNRLLISFLFILYVCLNFPIRSFGQSNEGQDFWFVFLEHHDRTNNKKCIVTSKFNTKG
jgi:hypothetical protein